MSPRAKTRPHIQNARYAKPAGARQRAYNAVKYLTRGRGEVAMFGSAEGFTTAARERAARMKAGGHKGERAAFATLVLSPRRGAEYTDDDFKKMLDTWTVDQRTGERYEYFAVVHRDTENHHMHVLVARDWYEKHRELPAYKRRDDEVHRAREKAVRKRYQRREQALERERAEPEMEPAKVRTDDNHKQMAAEQRTPEQRRRRR